MPETLTIELRESGGSRPGQDYQPPPPPAYTPPAPPAPAMPPVGQPTTAPAVEQAQEKQQKAPPSPPPVQVSPPPPLDVKAEAERRAMLQLQQQELAQLVRKQMAAMVPTLEEVKPPPPPPVAERVQIKDMSTEEMANEARRRLDAGKQQKKFDDIMAYRAKMAEPEKPLTDGDITKQFGSLIGGAGLPGLGNPISKIGSAMETAGPAMAKGGLSAAIPPLAIATAAKELKEHVEESARGLVKSFGQIATKAAALDTSVFAEQFEKAADQAGLLGVVASEGSKQLRMFDSALADTAKRLSQYNGTLAVAEAQAEVTQIFGDIRRADLLGKDLADLTVARSRLSQTGQDALARAVLPLIPKLTALIEMLVPLVETLGKTGEVVTTILPDLLETARVYGDSKWMDLPDTLSSLKDSVAKAVRKLLAGDEASKDDEKFLGELLRAREAFRGR